MCGEKEGVGFVIGWGVHLCGKESILVSRSDSFYLYSKLCMCLHRKVGVSYIYVCEGRNLWYVCYVVRGCAL